MKTLTVCLLALALALGGSTLLEAEALAVSYCATHTSNIDSCDSCVLEIASQGFWYPHEAAQAATA
jgi:hypothetical protein